MLLHSVKEKNMQYKYCEKDGQEYQFTTMSTTSTQKNSNLMDLIKSTLLRLEYLANLSPLPESEMVKKMKDICGQSSNASLLILDQNTSYWRTYGDYCQSSLWTESPEGCLDKFSSTFWKSGIVAHGLCMEQPMLARHTKEKECSSWPTPRVGDVSGGDRTKWAAEGKWQTGLREAVNLQNWPTPRANKVGGSTSEGYGLCLDEAVNGGRKAQNWPTPTANEDAAGTANGKMQKMLGNNPAIRESGKGALSADWVEILMGLPIGWTDIEKSNEDLDEWPGWPAPMNANQNWNTPDCSDRRSMKSKQQGVSNQVKITSSGQYPYEPPRVVEGQKNRAKRLKCLGNGCCPAQIYPIFKAIMEAEK